MTHRAEVFGCLLKWLGIARTAEALQCMRLYATLACWRVFKASGELIDSRSSLL